MWRVSGLLLGIIIWMIGSAAVCYLYRSSGLAPANFDLLSQQNVQSKSTEHHNALRYPLAANSLIAKLGNTPSTSPEYEALAQAILKRIPRSNGGYLAKLKIALDRQDYTAALDEIQRLLRIDGQNRNLYFQILETLSVDEAGKREVLSFIRDNPASDLGPLINRLNASNPDIGFLVEINQILGLNGESLVKRLLSQGQLERAFLLADSLAPNSPSESSVIYDPNFKGGPRARPFNWTLLKDTELTRPEGLFLIYNGRYKPGFLSQTLLLSPGSYEIEIVASGESSASSGKLSLSVRCLNKKDMLSSIEINTLTLKRQIFYLSFPVPDTPECQGQVLELSGFPGEFPTWTRANIHSIDFVRPEAKAEGF